MTNPAHLGTNHSGNTLPMKLYPIGRADHPSDASLLPQSSGGPLVAMSAVAVNATGTISGPGTPLSTITNAVSTNPIISSSIHGHSQNMVQLHGPINVHGSHVGIHHHGTPYYLDKNVNVSVLQAGQHAPTHLRPVTLLEKRSDIKGLASGSMILTTHPQGVPSSVPTLTMPLAPHQVSISQAISVSHNSSSLSNVSHSQIFTTMPSHLLPPSFSGSGPSVVATPLSHQHPTSISTPLSVQQTQASIITSGSNTYPVTAVNLTPCTSGGSNSTCVVTFVGVTNLTTANTTATSSSLSQTIVSTNGSSTVSTAAPVQSPNQKSTHSPRPSILRKREMNDHAPSRAQRNLSMSLNYVSNNAANNATASAAVAVAAAKDNCDRTSSCSVVISSNNPVIPLTSSVSTANPVHVSGIPVNPVVVTTAVSCSSSSSSCSGISILKKEFQPPNEESSWQSCGSNSSGSTTISATSETAEIQMQNAGNNGLGDLGQEIRDYSSNSLPSSSGYNFSSSGSIAHNGILRSASAAVHHGKGGRSFGSKAQSKDIDRLKARAKDDCVSPRKKPRKQLL